MTGRGRKIAVQVDLTPLRPGGSNGGLKPAIFELLRELGRGDSPFVFVYLTSACSHPEIRALARPCDLVLCVREDIPWSHVREASCQREVFLPDPPEDLPRRLGVDVCYSPFGALFYQVPEIPSVSLVVDLLHADWPFGLPHEERMWREKYIASACKRAAFVQCLSRTGAEKLAKRYRMERDKVFHTYLPIHGRLAQAPKSPDGSRFFFYPANFWPHKNHEALLLAFNLYAKRHKNGAPWQLHLTGHPDKRMDDLCSLAAALGLADQVVFHGHVPEDKLAGLYAGAGCLVFPSLHEGFGIPLLEAWHYGVPVIASDLATLKEIGGNACRYADPRNPELLARAMAGIAESREAADACAQRGRERLELFKLEAEAAELAEKWKALAGLGTDEKARGFLLLELPSPADGKRWTLSLRLAATAPPVRLFIQLGRDPFGSHPAGAGETVELACVPQGRRLRLFLEDAASGDAAALLAGVRFTDEAGKSLEVFAGGA
jgi:glycosyltransferase involved in cell wall biosynthesis